MYNIDNDIASSTAKVHIIFRLQIARDKCFRSRTESRHIGILAKDAKQPSNYTIKMFFRNQIIIGKLRGKFTSNSKFYKNNQFYNTLTASADLQSKQKKNKSLQTKIQKKTP